MTYIKDLLEAITGRITMYRLILASLALVSGWAVILSFTGDLSYTPIHLMFSAIILGIVSYATNLLFGKLYGLRPHAESSLITAGILFCIVSPATTAQELFGLVFVATAAMASKYLLAYKGRHIVNPAVAGILVAAILKIDHASWWTSQPLLLPVVGATSFIILYKTRKLAMGSLFVAVGVALLVAQTVLDGDSVNSIFPLALTSFPTIFLAGFMLSEPLTLPPRRTQQLVYAAGTAFLFATSFRIGGIFISPEAALAIGNIGAFMVGQKHAITLRFIKQLRLTPTSSEYVFETNHTLRFTPGQYIEITLPHSKPDSRGSRRSFSLTSIPGNTQITIGVKIPPEPSSFKQKLITLVPGDLIQATLIAGDFELPKNPSAPILMAAGGIGITPFISQLRTMAKQGETRDITLLYFVNAKEELAYLEELQTLNIRILICSPDKENAKNPNCVYTGIARPNTKDIKQLVPDIGLRHAYISGPPQMVLATAGGLKTAGVASVTTDFFSGY